MACAGNADALHYCAHDRAGVCMRAGVGARIPACHCRNLLSYIDVDALMLIPAGGIGGRVPRNIRAADRIARGVEMRECVMPVGEVEGIGYCIRAPHLIHLSSLHAVRACGCAHMSVTYKK